MVFQHIVHRLQLLGVEAAPSSILLADVLVLLNINLAIINLELAQQSLRSVLCFCNSPLMNTVEAYIQFKPGLITPDGEVTDKGSINQRAVLARMRDAFADRPFGTLSGGERGRLALAKLALSDANLLLLDEPTNHLDLPTQEVLQSILADYRGTIILVSHDRYLIDALASQIWEVDPLAETLHWFEGGYTQYKAERSARQLQNTLSKAEQVASMPAAAKSTPVEGGGAGVGAVGDLNGAAWNAGGG